MGAPQPTRPAGDRKVLGAWYTPEALVDHVVELTLPTRVGRPLRVLDPACGDGAFLRGVRRRLGAGVELFGVDVDPVAVAAARAAVPGAEILLGDALTIDWAAKRFDVVVGNPPFLNQMARATTRGGRSRFGGGPYADVAAEFLALSIQLVGPGGRVGLVLPQSLLTTRDAGPIRAAVLDRASLVHAWWSTAHEFDAAVHTCALVFEVGSPSTGVVTRTFGIGVEPRQPVTLTGSWGALLLDTLGEQGRPADGAALGSIATFTVDFRDQYYGLIGAVSDHADGPPLITSGLIEPGRCLWGDRAARFGKQRYAAPRVDLALLAPKLQRWAVQRLVPKILIANQTRVIEAVIDRHGEWLPSVPTLTCTAANLDEVFAVLASPAATDWVRHHAAGSGLSAHSIRLTPALLASIPLPLALA